MKREIEVVDLAPTCCAAYGVDTRSDRPCLLFRNLLSEEEATAMMNGVCQRHETSPRSLEVGVRSEFQVDDAKLSSDIFSRIERFIPHSVDGGQVCGLRTEWHHGKQTLLFYFSTCQCCGL
jgi:hypothetical protein